MHRGRVEKMAGWVPALKAERAGQWEGKLSKQTTIERASGMFYWNCSKSNNLGILGVGWWVVVHHSTSAKYGGENETNQAGMHDPYENRWCWQTSMANKVGVWGRWMVGQGGTGKAARDWQ